MKITYIAYTRVSTFRQSTEGVSLAEQQHAIRSYACRHQLDITAWHEKVTTAAKRGRPVFAKLIGMLREANGAFGLIMHKIDRGARNLRDWADVGELIDQGIEVRFVHDDLDLHTRGGRLSADIQAVIAADYIRNLREEVRKGLLGRLRQGIYPFAAPLGYQNRGSGRVKLPDPIVAPLIIQAFERYASGRYTLRRLASELAMLGLTQRHGRPLRPSALARILHNPFYAGKFEVSGARYHGLHQPLIETALFDRVQTVLSAKRHRKVQRHQFQYRGSLICQHCCHALTGERQKTYVYYRCHYCPGVSVREDRVTALANTEQTNWLLDEVGKNPTLPYQQLLAPAEPRQSSNLIRCSKVPTHLQIKAPKRDSVERWFRLDPENCHSRTLRADPSDFSNYLVRN